MENGTLLLRRTDERDSGMYICIARNNAGTAMAQIFLRMFSEYPNADRFALPYKSLLSMDMKKEKKNFLCIRKTFSFVQSSMAMK